MSYAIVFPGQGTQSVSMLASLADKYPLVEEIFSQASKVLGFDLWHLTQTDEEALNQSDNTQVAVLTASYANYQVLKLNYPSLSASYLAGHSLGEYTALIAGGYLTFEAGLTLVRKRAQLMQAAMAESSGAMAAILGLSEDKVIALCSQINCGVVEAANFNAPHQIVISGDKKAVLLACDLMKKHGAKRTVILAVSVASHCRLMRSIDEQFRQILEQTKIVMGSAPVIHNVNYQNANNVEQIKKNLLAQLYSPVRWTKTIEKICAQGIKSIIECGPGKVLSGLNRRIDKSIESYLVSDETALKNTLKAISL